MTSNQTHEGGPSPHVSHTIAHLCLKSCQKVLAQIRKVKGAFLNEWRARLREHQQMLRLALNEAEALAWQTDYPHLLFPTLAAEKAQGVLDWVRRQEDVRRQAPLRLLETSATGSVPDDWSHQRLREAA